MHFRVVLDEQPKCISIKNVNLHHKEIHTGNYNNW